MARDDALTPRMRFWRWVAIFAWRRMNDGLSTSRHPDGLPGIRDRDSRCAAYEPRPQELGDFDDCEGDGHYLCQVCCHLVDHRRPGYVPPEGGG